MSLERLQERTGGCRRRISGSSTLPSSDPVRTTVAQRGWPAFFFFFFFRIPLPSAAFYAIRLSKWTFSPSRDLGTRRQFKPQQSPSDLHPGNSLQNEVALAALDVCPSSLRLPWLCSSRTGSATFQPICLEDPTGNRYICSCGPSGRIESRFRRSSELHLAQEDGDPT